LEMTFPYFLQKSSGQAQAVGMKEYRCTMHGSLEKTDDLVLEIQVPISPPAPSQRGQGLPRSLGHWGRATIRLRFKHFIWIEEIIQLVEEVTSHDLCWPTAEACAEYTLSVESITTALGRTLENHAAIAWFSVLVENLSQGYNTFASLEWQNNPAAS
ncbi:MAG: GTP cyclohydrolase, FolE2/MptA family, partial [Desulfurivibrionaceae bacterium]